MSLSSQMGTTSHHRQVDQLADRIRKRRQALQLRARALLLIQMHRGAQMVAENLAKAGNVKWVVLLNALQLTTLQENAGWDMYTSERLGKPVWRHAINGAPNCLRIIVQVGITNRKLVTLGHAF